MIPKPSPNTTDARLDAARREHEAAYDEMVDFVMDALALLASEEMRERADLIKARWKKAGRDRDEAKVNHITRLVLERSADDRRVMRENRERIERLESTVTDQRAELIEAFARIKELEAWAYGGSITVERIPPPGQSDEHDPTGHS